MRMIWITPECPYPPNTGGRIGMWKRIQYLSKTNEIYLYSIIDDENEKQYVEDIKLYCRSVKMYSRYSVGEKLLQSVLYPYPAVSRWNRLLKSDLDYAYKTLKPDCVLVDFPQMMGCLPDSILQSGRIVLNQGNIEFKALASLSKSLGNPLKRIAYLYVSLQMMIYEKRIYTKDCISLYTFVSTSDKKYFDEKYPDRNTLLVPVGTEIKERTEIIRDCHNLVFIAKMSYPANEEGALWILKEVLPYIETEVPDVHVYLVGKDPGPVLVDEAGKNRKVTLTGTVDSVDLYYDMTNVALVPILTGGGVNIKLLEALGQGKLVVTTPKGIEGTELVHGEHVFVANNAEKFAQYCIKLLLFPDIYEDMLINVRKIIEEKYSWEGVVKEFETELKKLTATR